MISVCLTVGPQPNVRYLQVAMFRAASLRLFAPVIRVQHSLHGAVVRGAVLHSAKQVSQSVNIYAMNNELGRPAGRTCLAGVHLR